ncbi:TonB-dependent siderophore receptor [Sphingomonas arantia]|uniref:TonB-dependent siderophore receptor n=1 Tax=Sphingomonas arantia TaxID=1460676 RepID=A0ABW4TUE3_9SPHN
MLSFMLAAAAAGSVASATSEQRASPRERPLDEEIVVTGAASGYDVDTVQVGSFRNRGVLDTPATVNVVNRSLLNDQGALGLDDALRNTPGVTQQTTSPFNSNTFLARGIAIDAQTNYRLNGGLPIVNFAPMPLEDKERVELLKGASALYYGIATPSGVVNLVTKRAGPRNVTAAYGIGDSEGGFGGGVDIGRRFGNERQFGVRLNAFSARTRSTTDGVGGDRQVLSGAFDWTAGDHLTVQADVEYYRRKGEEPGGITLPAAVRGVITLPAVPSPRQRYAPDGAPFTTQGLNAVARVDYRFAPGWSARVEGGIANAYRDRLIATLGTIDLATGAGRLTLTGTPDQFWQNRYVRAELAGGFMTGPVDHDLLIGVATTRQYRRDQRQVRYSPLAQNLYDPVAIDLASLVPATRTVNAGNTVTDTGAYVMDVMSLGKDIDIVAGVRGVSYRTQAGDADYTVHAATPTAALILHPTATTSLYASYIEGLESAGVAPDGTANVGETLGPARSRQWEIGARAKLLGVTASLSWFDIDRALAYTDAANVYVANGRANHRGIEGSILGAIGHGFDVALTGQYLDAVQKRTGSAALDGRRVLNAPRWSGSAFVQYRPSGWDRFAVNAGTYYTGARFADTANLARLPGFVTYSAGASYRLPLDDGRTLTLRVNGDNLTDRRYWATGGTTLYVGAARTVRMSASLEL